MKKIRIIFMGLLMLNGLTEIHQLMKLPFLIKHYIDHHEENTSLSFIDFLKMHYTDKEDPNDNDDKEDNELPFKSTGNTSHTDTAVIEKRISADCNFYLHEKLYTYRSEGIPDQRSSSIFHPPRIA